MTPETFIKRTICSWLKGRGAFIFVHDSVGIFDPIRRGFRKNYDPHRIKGVSDILGIWKGQFLAIEVKVAKKYPSKEQKEFIANVIEHGGVAFVARSVEDCEKELLGVDV
jgi:penicillin-binding protein-related factor A (putative recombinase)